MPLISIIIPVYNVEEFLRHCLDSIIQQPYVDYEVILINDGSTDRSPIICDDYAEKYPQLSVIHKENGGVSSARNVGLDVAKGEWIWFVDSDDWISSDSLFTLAQVVSSNNTDIVIFGIEYQDIHGNILYRDERIRKSGIIEEVIASNDYAPPSLIMRRDIIESNQIRFSCGIRMFEDLEFQYKILMLSKYATIIPNTLYFVLRHEGSAVSNSKSIQNAAEDIPIVLGHIVNFIESYKVKERLWLSARINRIFKSCISMNSLIEQPNIDKIQKIVKKADCTLRSIGYIDYRDAAVFLGCIDIRINFYFLRIRRLLIKWQNRFM